MSILKAPPKPPKNATLQLRIDEGLKTKLDKYAEFLESSTAYVVSEALKLVFNKDAEFRKWLESQAVDHKKSIEGETPSPVKSAKQLAPPVVSLSANSNGLFR
jgi:predicted transcriptional regulator